MKRKSIVLAVTLFSLANAALSYGDTSAANYYQQAQNYADNKQYQPALDAINRAVALQPNNIEYLQQRADIAEELSNNAVMEDSYNRILRLRPNDKNATYQRILAESYQESEMDQAAVDFQKYLARYPNDKEAWLSYASLENWRDNNSGALAVLEQYRLRFGTTKEYLQEKARILASVGRYESAIAINTPLLRQDPNNYDLLYTNAMSLDKEHRRREALVSANKLKVMQPTSQDTSDLMEEFQDAQPSTFNVGGSFLHDTTPLNAYDFPIAVNLYWDDDTRLIAEGLEEALHTKANDGFDTVNGQQGITDTSLWAGVQHRFMPCFDLKALAGGLHIEGLDDKFIYLVQGDFDLNETANLTILHLQNLYRPYLVGTSPLTVSEGVTENLTSAILNWSPILDYSVPVLADYSTMSDTNTYYRINVAPQKRIFINSKTALTAGVEADWLSFSEQLDNGYYDPSLHQEYLATAGIEYTHNDKWSFNLAGGAGIHKDETFDSFEPAFGGDYGVAYAITKRCNLTVGGDYTYRGKGGEETISYQGYTVFAKFAAQLA